MDDVGASHVTEVNEPSTTADITIVEAKHILHNYAIEENLCSKDQTIMSL